MITDCYDIQSEPLLSLRDFYGEPGHKVEKCLILFSKHIHQHLLVNFDCEPIGTLNSCNGSKTIYQFCHEGENIGFYLTDLGSATMTVEAVLDFLDDDEREHVRFADGPLVEGAVAAGVTAQVGGDIGAVAQAALARELFA